MTTEHIAPLSPIENREKTMKKTDPKNQNRHVISFRVSSEEYATLLRQAQKCGGNLSLLIRKKLEMHRREAGAPR